MKRYLSLMLALALTLTLFTGCAASGPEPAPEPEPEPVSEPEAAPAAVEGVVKEVSQGKLVLTLADGTSLVLDAGGGLEAGPGDTVRVEYTGEIGSLTAGKVEILSKAEASAVTVRGVVTGIQAGYLFLTLEDGTEAALGTGLVEGYQVEAGDAVTVTYLDGGTEDGVEVVSVEVVKAETEEAPAPAVSQAAQEADAGGGSGSGTGASAQSPARAASYTVTAVVTSLTPELFTIDQDDGAVMTLDRKLFEGQVGRQFRVGDVLTVGYVESGNMGRISWMELTGFNSAVSAPANSYDGNDDGGYYDYDNDDEDYTSSGNDNSGPSEAAGDVYEAIRLINAERTKAGLKELTINSDLMAMAAARAEEMSILFEHLRPDGSDWKTIFTDFGWEIPSKRGENGYNATSVKLGTASHVIESWMGSSGHKANILKDDVDKIGVGFYRGSGSETKCYWTMIVSS